MTDLFRLLDRLEPPQDGESPVRHRTGTVDAVNSDGTVDLDLGGIVVDSVAVLAGAFIAVGATVQVAVWRGDLLVLGAVRTANQGGPLGVLGYAEATSNQTGITSEVSLTGLEVIVDVAADRRIKVTGGIHVLSSVSGDRASWFINTDAAILQRIDVPLGTASEVYDSQRSIVVTPSAGSVTFRLRMSRQSGSGSLTMVAANGRKAFILAEDTGPA